MIKETPTITGEDILHQWKFLCLKKLELTHLDGEKTSYEYVERNAAMVFWIVSVLPITESGEIIMIRQYRAPLDRIQLELPAGCAERGKHTTLEDAVHAELREETGYVSDDIAHITEFSSSSGMTNEIVHGFVARNCKRVSDVLTLDTDEYIERVLVPIQSFQSYIFSELARGAIIEPKMLAMTWWWEKFANTNNPTKMSV